MHASMNRSIRDAVPDTRWNRIFLLTFFQTNSIYESHCDFSESQNLNWEIQSMKNATKKKAAAKKAPAKKAAAKKKK